MTSKLNELNSVKQLDTTLGPLIEKARTGERGYASFYKKVAPLIEFIYYKKFSGNDSFKEELAADAQLAIYKELIERHTDLSTIRNIFNFTCNIIYRAFLNGIVKEIKEKDLKTSLIKEERLKYQFKQEWWGGLDLDDKVLLYNRLMSKINYLDKDEFKLCKFLAAVMVVDKSRLNYPLPKFCNSFENLQFYIDKIQCLHYIALDELKKEGVL